MTWNWNWTGGSDARVTRPSTQKEFCTQTSVGRRPSASQTSKAVEATGALLAVLLMYKPVEGERRSGRSPEKGGSASWSHDSASASNSVGFERWICVFVGLRGHQCAVKNVSSNTRLRIHPRSCHVRGRWNCHSSRVVCFSCVTALKSCTVTTVDFVVLHDNLGGISSVSLGLVCAAVFLSTSLTELLVSAASLHHHPAF